MAESMQGLKRTHRCGELSAADIGKTVTIMGWVQKNRNKGGLVFTDVRDRSGIIQVVCEEGKTDPALIAKAARLRSEYVVAVVGTVEKRSGAVNENLKTGEIEVIPEELRILSESETPPFPIEEELQDQGRDTSEIPLSGPSQTGSAEEPADEKPGGNPDPPVPGGKRDSWRSRRRC